VLVADQPMKVLIASMAADDESADLVLEQLKRVSRMNKVGSI